MKEIIRDFILAKLGEIKSNSSSKLSEEEIISGLFATVIKNIEAENNLLFDTIITDVPPPKGATGSVGKYIGSCAEAIIVKNVSVINPIKFEEV
jgi:hypothetical protein